MYKLISTDTFEKQFKKLDHSVQIIVKKWIDKNLINCDNPKVHEKQLTANLRRYRIGDYRLLVEIDDSQMVIISINIGHRREIYRK